VTDRQTDRRTDGQTELRWLRHAKAVAAFGRKKCRNPAAQQAQAALVTGTSVFIGKAQ